MIYMKKDVEARQLIDKREGDFHHTSATVVALPHLT
jgi:hypothetical protein